jgi:hypothetical protein
MYQENYKYESDNPCLQEAYPKAQVTIIEFRLPELRNCNMFSPPLSTLNPHHNIPTQWLSGIFLNTSVTVDSLLFILPRVAL